MFRVESGRRLTKVVINVRKKLINLNIANDIALNSDQQRIRFIYLNPNSLRGTQLIDDDISSKHVRNLNYKCNKVHVHGTRYLMCFSYAGNFLCLSKMNLHCCERIHNFFLQSWMKTRDNFPIVLHYLESTWRILDIPCISWALQIFTCGHEIIMHVIPQGNEDIEVLHTHENIQNEIISFLTLEMSHIQQ